MSLPPAFPSIGSIPPATFYDRFGLSNWLNQNPDYKQYFINYPTYFPNLYPQSFINELISSSQISGSSIYANYDIRKVPLGPIVTTLSQQQAMEYNKQLELFQRVYTYNSNAYISTLTTGRSPMYYRFLTSGEHTQYRAALKTVTKLYPFDAMLYGTSEYGSTLGWKVPFPL
jgi:hypothetical protein